MTHTGNLWSWRALLWQNPWAYGVVPAGYPGAQQRRGISLGYRSPDGHDQSREIFSLFHFLLIYVVASLFENSRAAKRDTPKKCRLAVPSQKNGKSGVDTPKVRNKWTWNGGKIRLASAQLGENNKINLAVMHLPELVYTQSELVYTRSECESLTLQSSEWNRDDWFIIAFIT